MSEEIIIQSSNPTPPSGISSIEVSKNSKGYTWSVKAYQTAGASLEMTMEQVKRINNDLEKTYGGGN